MHKVHFKCVIKTKKIRIVFLVGLCIYRNLCKVVIKIALEKIVLCPSNLGPSKTKELAS